MSQPHLMPAICKKHILAHRGFWSARSEMNTEAAFRKALENGFGIETDIRDLDGKIVISHDPPISGQHQTLVFEDFVNICGEYDPTLPIALNVKSDGLQRSLQQSIGKSSLNNFVLFDMSIPDLVQAYNADLPFLTRCSELEKSFELVAFAKGIWVDELTQPWLNDNAWHDLAQYGKALYFVSPELHNRDHIARWADLFAWQARSRISIYLCTDFPDSAAQFFWGIE